jgi:protein-S-isoprenylcysteine O-methyltransferase Ste14
MQAGEREYRYRFWMIFGLFFVAFSCYWIDHTNAAVALLRLIAPSLDPDGPRGGHALQLVLGFGAVLGLSGAWLRSWATSYLKSDVVHDAVVRTEGLVADGPYRHVRNPLYLGTQLLMCGMALATSRLGALLLIVGGLVIHLRLIGREEAALATAQGEPFRAYCARVPRLVPSLTPRVPAAGRTPEWLQGVVGESFMWVIGGALAVFAITLESRALLYTALGGVALRWLLDVLRKRRRPGAGTTG